ncbi:hypothetical protein [Streptomyces sp. AP-93]|uniref:hypothetical protein n=1 Tax=Streptomyces sp. AP-93 TaxID=2929048 RepID=UPI001FAF31DB|nr:hypothetical protein [Streptomyces sp. AP-93]MCJ0875795.1 hypothetical protein [Streptomyces sp. AP-93]
MPTWTPSAVLFDNLRYLLNEWDPIGVADLSQDEYDCMLAPFVPAPPPWHHAGEIGEFLWYELEDHFGLDPVDHGTDAVADRLIAWWSAVGPAPAGGTPAP